MKKLTKALFLNLVLVLMAGLCMVAAGPAVAVDVCPVTLTYIAGPHGSISGEPSQVQVVDCGGNGTAVTAVADDCYHFVKWSDDSTANPRQDINVSGNIMVTASFDINTYTLSYTADSNGTILGTTSQTVNCGGNGTAVTAVPVDPVAYHFDKWSDGSTANPRTDVNVTKDNAAQAVFSPCFAVDVTMDENTITAILDGVQMSFQGCGNMTVSMDQNTVTGLWNGETIISLPNSTSESDSLDSLCANFQVVMGNKMITANIGNGAYGLSVTDGCSSIALNGVPITSSCALITLPAEGLPDGGLGNCTDITAQMDGKGITATVNGEQVVASSTCSDITFDVNENRTITANLNGESIALPIDVLYYGCTTITIDMGDNQTMTANYANNSFTLSIIDGCRSVNYYIVLPTPPPCVVAVQVLPDDVPVQIGGTMQFTAIAFYSDGSYGNITSLASWNSTNQTVAVIDNAGLAQGKAAGVTFVQATYNGISSAPATLTVMDASMSYTLVSLEVRPGNATIQAGDTQQFTAWANFSGMGEVDITYLASWSIGNESVDNMSDYGEFDAATLASLGIGNESIGNGSVAMVSYGVAIGLAPGTAQITATFQGVSDDAVLSVTAPTLPVVEWPVVEPPPGNATKSLVVEPSSASVVVGGTQQLTATVHYYDGTTADVTSTAIWNSSIVSVCTVSSGSATGVAPGVCAIIATYGNVISNPAVLTVPATKATLERIVVAPGNATFSIGGTLQFTATAYYSDGSSKDVTNEVVWSSSKDGIATINNAGLASGSDVGESEITASLQQVTSAPASVSVVPVLVPWSMIGGIIIGAVLVLGLLFLALIRRRTKGEGV